MWNDCSYNLDHSDHVRFKAGKKEEVLIEHQESSVFSLGYHYYILAGSLSGEEYSITMCYE